MDDMDNEPFDFNIKRPKGFQSISESSISPLVFYNGDMN